VALNLKAPQKRVHKLEAELRPPPAPEFEVVVRPVAGRGGDGRGVLIDGDVLVIRIAPPSFPGASLWQ